MTESYRAPVIRGHYKKIQHFSNWILEREKGRKKKKTGRYNDQKFGERHKFIDPGSLVIPKQDKYGANTHLRTS